MATSEVITLLREKIARAGSATAWARENKISPAYVSDALSGHRQPGKRILGALGVECVKVYRRVR